MIPELLFFCLATVAAGAVVGLLAGLLGIGGGLILVPMLFELIQRLGADEATAVRAAIATSLATVIVSGFRSALSHRRRGSLDRDLVSAWAPAIVLGALIGAEIANRVDPATLITAFAVITGLLASNMVFGRQQWRLGERPPGRVWRTLSGAGVGITSAMLGLGVAGLGVPLMTLFNAPVRAAVAVAALLGGIAAVPATIRFVVGGWGEPGLPPWSFGYVNVLGFALIVPMLIWLAPVGAAWSHRISQTVLKRVFAAFLAVNALRMLTSLL